MMMMMMMMMMAMMMAMMIAMMCDHHLRLSPSSHALDLVNMRVTDMMNNEGQSLNGGGVGVGVIPELCYPC